MCSISEFLFIKVRVLLGFLSIYSNFVVKKINGSCLFIKSDWSFQIVIKSSISTLFGLSSWDQWVSTFIETVKSFFSAQRFSERFECAKFTHSVLVQLFDAVESFFSNSFLIICQEKTSEVWPLEKVFTLVLGFWHAQNVLMSVTLIFFPNRVFVFQLRFGSFRVRWSTSWFSATATDFW